MAGVLRPGQQCEGLRDCERFFGSLGKIHRRIVVVGSLEIVRNLGVTVDPGQIAAVPVAVQGRVL